MWKTMYEAWWNAGDFWLKQWEQYNKTQMGWLGLGVEMPAEKKKYTVENSSGQSVPTRFAELQRLSRYYLLRKQVGADQGIDLELENALLDLYANKVDEDWEWYPDLQQVSDLNRLVREHPSFFELEGDVMAEDGEYEYRLLALGIHSKPDNVMLRRAVVTAYRKRSEAEVIAYLNDLAGI